MSVSAQSPPVDPQVLRSQLHQCIDAVADEDLAEVHRQWMELELTRLWNIMCEGAQKDMDEGRLEPDDIEAAIKAHRARHPYR